MFKELDDVMSILKGVRLLRSTDDRTSGIVSGYGELWSARILHAFLQKEGFTAVMVDAREVLTVALALSDGSNASSNASVPIEGPRWVMLPLVQQL